VFRRIVSDSRLAYRQPYVVKWCVWAIVSTTLNFQVGNYIQPLWTEVRSADQDGKRHME
jgi:hypothetical protein